MPEDGTFAVRDSHLDAIREAVTEGASPLEAPTSSLAVVVTLAWNPTVAPGRPEVARLYCQSTPLTMVSITPVREVHVYLWQTLTRV
jgi:hypothetical protein